jgi:hypothetical protein
MKFTSITRCHSAAVSSHARPNSTMPALEQTNWTGPRPNAVRAMRSMSAAAAASAYPIPLAPPVTTATHPGSMRIYSSIVGTASERPLPQRRGQRE